MSRNGGATVGPDTVQSDDCVSRRPAAGGRRRWALLAVGVLLAACGPDRSPGPDVDDPLDPGPARRILTLAPHLTELAYTAGAGEQLAGAVEFSDFPVAAQALPRIGDAFRLDQEAIAGLDPDLILAWQSGTPVEVIERLQQQGYRVVTLPAGRLLDIAASLRAIGRLAATEAVAEAAAADFERALAQLRAEAAGYAPVRVFFQVTAQPLFTVSDRHVIGEAIALCGGQNIFGALAGLSPSVSPEAVIDAAPDAIIAARHGTGPVSAERELGFWRQWSSVPAVRDGHLFLIDANLVTRPSVRFLGGMRELCAHIGAASHTRQGPSPDVK